MTTTAALLAAVIGTLVLLGWAIDMPSLRAPPSSDIDTKANTAVGLLLCGVSLHLLAHSDGRAWRRPVGTALALVIIALGALTLMEYLLGVDLGIDQLLVHDRSDTVLTIQPGRPAPQTAAILVFAGTALALLRTRFAGTRAIEMLGVVILLVALLTVAGYGYDLPRLAQLRGANPMAFCTAIAFLGLAVGLLAATPGPLMAAVSGPGAGSIAGRRLIPLAIIGFLVLGLLRRAGQDLGLYSYREGVALLLICQVVVLVGGILVMARLANIADHQRLEARSDLERKVLERTAELASSRLEIVQRLAFAAEYRDDDTYHHTERVGRTSGLLAQRLGLAPNEVARIRQAAPLHDIGKLAVSDLILLKPGKLTDEEFDIVKAHTVVGAQILRGSSFDVLQLAERAALYHHERWDGTGYPMGLVGEGIPLVGRIVAVADVFDALTHERPYKAAWPHSDAVAEIRAMSGLQFDPRIVECFLALDREGMLADPPMASNVLAHS